ncbi:MAG TPA: isoprenylcysteine carboxylmethyltransferase family protein [Vicinamibacterales bacterium]|nr:isoprenylcysteine carboxylmethyltransferase family protein [Vicinamibacterales bacterium]
MGARAFAWLGGVLFVTSLGTCAWTYIFVMGRPAPAAGLLPLAADAALITIFAMHHSVFARERVKTWLARSLPEALLRSVYVWIASMLLILVCVLWRPVGGELYASTGLLAIALTLVQLAGFLITARGVARIDPLELAGIRPAGESQGLQVEGPYRWVRHPLYLGWFLMVFGAAHMTGDRLAFAAATTLYLMIAIPWEERSLRLTFGDAYARYTRDVRWRMIPFIY